MQDASGTLAATIARASEALAADPALAERLANSILKTAPTDPRALLVLASARRRQGDALAARALLAPLAEAHPGAAHTHYELGMALAALGETAPSIAALRQAVGLRRELAEAWRGLGDQLFQAGDAAGAEAAYAEFARASVRDPALRPAAEAIFEGRLDVAEDLLRRRLAVQPADVAALHMLAEVSTRAGRDGDAERLCAQCVELDPDFHAARFSYAMALFRQQKGAAALPHLERLLARDGRDPAYRNLMAACLCLVGDYDRAIAIYEALLTDYPRQAGIWLNYGHALRTLGRREDAVTAYHRCLALAPGLGEAYWSLANLKVRQILPKEEAAMEMQLGRPDLGAEDRLHLHYALGKAQEDRGEYAASFENYARGAELRRLELRYDAEASHALMRRSKALFTEAFFEAHAGGGSRSDAPIFIVGLPRSGSTLVEQILASHSRVEGTMELPDIAFIARRLDRGAEPANPRPYPEALADLDRGAATALGDDYVAGVQVHRRLGRAFFIDKMPNNFHHIGLIQLILPRARIIDARRHPLGSGWSAFKQHFAHGHAFSYDLSDLGRYYRDYVELMAHVDAVLPGRIHRVIYEDLVENTEHEVRRLLTYCGLAFEPGCLTFYENDRAVRTVSSEQVRRPIFRDGLDQWRRYEPWLGDLKAALGPALETWR
ncbi:MAG: hypothetical protein JWP49_2822 [Phenylobacterium sp.]|nr:hypothetical protein [Phenylobacterium sp.]